MRRLAVLGLLCVGVAACGSSGAKIGEAKLSALVLQPGDLPSGYVSFTNGAQSRADAHPGPRFDAARFGRLGGWIARYRRVAAGPRSRAAVVESRADLFPSSGGARKDLDGYATEFERVIANAGGRDLGAPRVGEAARAFAFGSAADRFVAVAWRSANATASVVVEGPSVEVADAVGLARKQQARIARAAS